MIVEHLSDTSSDGMADETTAIGEPRPGPNGRIQQAGPSFGRGSTTSYAGLVAMGAGVGLVFGILGKLLG